MCFCTNNNYTTFTFSNIKFWYCQVVSHHNSYTKEINKHIHSFIHSFIHSITPSLATDLLFWTLNIFHSVTFTMHHCCTISTGISFNKEGLIVKLACQYLIMRSAYTRDTLIKKLTTRQLHWHNQNKFAHRFVWATTKPVLSGADLLCRNSTLKD